MTWDLVSLVYLVLLAWAVVALVTPVVLWLQAGQARSRHVDGPSGHLRDLLIRSVDQAPIVVMAPLVLATWIVGPANGYQLVVALPVLMVVSLAFITISTKSKMYKAAGERLTRAATASGTA